MASDEPGAVQSASLAFGYVVAVCRKRAYSPIVRHREADRAVPVATAIIQVPILIAMHQCWAIKALLDEASPTLLHAHQIAMRVERDGQGCRGFLVGPISPLWRITRSRSKRKDSSAFRNLDFTPYRDEGGLRPSATAGQQRKTKFLVAGPPRLIASMANR